MTTLQELINRINVWTPIYAMSDVRKVNALDQAIRELRRKHQPYWTLRKTTLRVFDGVNLYPIASDHERLAFLSSTKENPDFADQPRYVFTSYKDFVENSTYRNNIAEIYENYTRMLAVKNKTNLNLTSTKLNEGET